MAIQGTEIPIYTNTLILYFSDFSIFIFYFYEKQNKAKLKKINKPKHGKQSNV